MKGEDSNARNAPQSLRRHEQCRVDYDGGLHVHPHGCDGGGAPDRHSPDGYVHPGADADLHPEDPGRLSLHGASGALDGGQDARYDS